VSRKPALKPAYKPTGAGTRIYLPQNVYDKALERVERIFDEFDNVIVRVSGGKDSTVLLHLALIVAEAKKRLPLTIYWLDQEAEWQATVDIVSEWMHRDDVKPIWLQVPFRITNATSQTDKWLTCWDPEREDDWVHPKDPIARHENVYGVDRLKPLFAMSIREEFGLEPVASLTGVRAEESPNRRKGLTSHLTYKDITWGAKEVRPPGMKLKEAPHYLFHPIYDWGFMDVWKCIHEHGLAYNAIYDQQYRYGVHLQKMRVSAIQHETSVNALFILQEFEPETYERMVSRLGGVDTAGKLGVDDFWGGDLPFMFEDWLEYRDYLFANLLDADTQQAMHRTMNEHDRKIPVWLKEEMAKVHVSAILANDRECVKLDNWFHTPQVYEAVKANRDNWIKKEAA
jgi:predicted phosphoadenosine phosphosulfate sulfurtransferase